MKETVVSARTPLDGLSQSHSGDLSTRLAYKLLGQIRRGSLTVVNAGITQTFGQDDEGPNCIVRVHDQVVFRKLIRGGSVGAAEAYMDGDWSTDDLTSVIRLFLQNRQILEDMETRMSWVRRLGLKLYHLGRRDSLSGSRRNIAEHYDLGNEFFQLFLDPTMMYSSGVFPSRSDSMEQASVNKMAVVCEKLSLGEDDHLLEIGTGWGGLAVYAAQHYGCRVTTTTISTEQYEHARAKVEAAGLTGQVTVLNQDYRELSGAFDKLVSIEMIEAVGLEHISTYLQKCASLLKPGATMLLQSITIADQRFHAASRAVDFIQRYIFPGGALPSITMLMAEATRTTDLRAYGLEDITEHYAVTLHKWREAFWEAVPQVRELGFDDYFIRMWDYYLAYCEGGFMERAISCVHLQFHKPEYRRVLA